MDVVDKKETKASDTPDAAKQPPILTHAVSQNPFYSGPPSQPPPTQQQQQQQQLAAGQAAPYYDNSYQPVYIPPPMGFSAQTATQAALWAPPTTQGRQAPVFQYTPPQMVYMPVPNYVTPYYGQSTAQGFIATQPITQQQATYHNATTPQGNAPVVRSVDVPQQQQQQQQPGQLLQHQAPGQPVHLPPPQVPATPTMTVPQGGVSIEQNMLTIMPHTKLPAGTPFCPPGVPIPSAYTRPPRRHTDASAAPARHNVPQPAAVTSQDVGTAHMHSSSSGQADRQYGFLGSNYAVQIRAHAISYLSRPGHAGSSSIAELCYYIKSCADENKELRECVSLEFIEAVLAAAPSEFKIFQYSREEILAAGITGSSVRPNELRFASALVDFRMRDAMKS